jgi:peptide/nickel transport system permease protein
MWSFVLRRLGSGLVVLAVVSNVTFLLLFFSGTRVGRILLGENATAEQVQAKEAELGLDRPLLARLGDWWTGAVRGDFGTSWLNQRPVFDAIGDRLPVTLALVCTAIVCISLVATLLGVTAAVKRGWVDRVVQVGALIGEAVPGFLIGLLLVTTFAIQLGWFPAISTIAPGAGRSAWVATLTLPVIALILNGAARTAQHLRSAVIKQLGMDYVRTLRSRGLPEREIVFRHVLRSAAPAALTVLSLQFIGMLSGVVVLEQIFALPGLGTLAVQATTTGDMPLVMGVVVYMVLLVVAVNLVVDLINGWLNPKVRVA